MIISFTNVIGAIRSLGEAAQVITTNLKMWLGFQTSETLGRELAPSSLSVVTDGDNGTITQISENSYSSSSDGTSGVIRPKFDFNTEDGKTYQLVITPSGTITGTVHFDFYDGSSYLFQDYDFTTTKEINFTDNGGVFGAFNGSQVYNITGFTISVKELTQITPDKSGNNNVGELFTGKALEFDGNGDYVDVDGFQMTGTSATFAFWFNSNDTLGRFFDTVKDLSDNRLILSFHNNQISILDHTLSWFNFGSVTTSVWNRCVITIKGTTAKCFVNGVQLGVDKTISTIDLSLNTDAAIGSHVFGTQSYFDGSLSDFQIYDKVWFADDIAYDYANPNKLAIDNPSTSLSVTNLKGYWALSEGDGLVAYDSGTNLEEEEVTNGDFATDSDWSEGTGWDIDVVNNKATCDGTQTGRSSLFQTGVLQQGVKYQFEFTLKDVTSGNVRLRNGIGASEIYISDKSLNDTYIVVTEVIASNQTLVVDADENFEGSVTNISVREVTASDHGGLVVGADYVPAQPRIPQLGMMNWSKGSNLYLNSEPTSNEAAAGDITYASYSWNYIGFKNATVFGDNSSTRFRYGGSVTSGLEYTLSAFVIMDDNSEPDITNTSSSGDFGIVLGNAVTGGTNTKTNVSGNIWRVSKTKTVSSTTTNNGIIKYTTQSSKGFNVVGWQLEESSSASAYRLTDGGATLNSTVIPNPTIPTQDIFGNAVRDRLNSFNLGKFGGARVDAFTLSGNQATIQLWFKNVNSNDSLYLADLHSATDRIVLGFNSSQLSVFHEITGGWQNFGTITDGDWNFATFTFDGTSLKCFVGTSQLGVTKTITAINLGTTTEFGIGMNHFSGTRTQDYNGHISDFLIYDRVLTSDEVENNYNAGLSAHTN